LNGFWGNLVLMEAGQSREVPQGGCRTAKVAFAFLSNPL
jgi:hypothetical protein